MEEVKERALLKMAVQRVIASGDGELLLDPEKREEPVHAALPDVVSWTPRMSEKLPEVVEEVFAEQAKKEQENDPEEVEEAKQELLEETKKFGAEAAEVIKLIEEGKEDEARAAMAQLEQRVKDMEKFMDKVENLQKKALMQIAKEEKAPVSGKEQLRYIG